MELHPAYPIATARLRLRPLTAADADALLAYRSQEEACRYVPFEPMDRATVLAKLEGDWARTEIVAEGDSLALGFVLERSSELIGDVTLFFRSRRHRSGEIGWMVHPDASGHGYATEAAHALLHLAFDDLGLHRMIARVDARNDQSLRLGDRLGMRREAHLVRNEWFKGEWTDEIDFALLEDEWAEEHAAGPHSCRWPLASRENHRQVR